MSDEGEDEESKTEEPTPERLRKAVEEGQVARSRDLAGVAGLTAIVGLTALAGDLALEALRTIAVQSFQLDHVSPARLDELGRAAALTLAQLALPPVAVAAVVALAATWAQGDLRWTSKQIAFDLSRIDPIRGLGRLLGWRGAIEHIGPPLLRILLVGAITIDYLRSRAPMVRALATYPPARLAHELSSVVMGVAWRAAGVLLVVGVVDYAITWWRMHRSLRMSKHEMREEVKEAEGDPRVKGRMRAKQREMARARMLDAVPKADVIVANPTHVAIALRYRPEEAAAPRIVARGVDALALRIRQIARASGVPVIENRRLARQLLARGKLGKEIPAELYEAVAGVLAFVLRLKARR